MSTYRIYRDGQLIEQGASLATVSEYVEIGKSAGLSITCEVEELATDELGYVMFKLDEVARVSLKPIDTSELEENRWYDESSTYRQLVDRHDRESMPLADAIKFYGMHYGGGHRIDQGHLLICDEVDSWTAIEIDCTDEVRILDILVALGY